MRTLTIMRARLAPDGQANFANSCTRLIRRPLRTQEMAEPEVAEVAKVLVPEQHSHLFIIQPVSNHNKSCNVV